MLSTARLRATARIPRVALLGSGACRGRRPSSRGLPPRFGRRTLDGQDRITLGGAGAETTLLEFVDCAGCRRAGRGGRGAPRSWARPAADHAATDANTTRLVAALLARSQFAHHPLDEQLASKLVTRYLEALDGTRSLFLQSDVTELTGHPRELARATTEAGDTRLAQAIFRRYLERLDQQVAYDTELLHAGQFDFTGHDVFTFERKQAPRPRDLTEARALWRQALRSEVLDEKLSDEKQTEAAIAAKLLRRYQQRQTFMHGMHDDDILAIYLDSLAHVYDPHSDYLGREEMQTFAIEMNLSVAGIGAALTSKDGVCTIHELIAGGPAARSGLLKPGDRITRGRAGPWHTGGRQRDAAHPHRPAHSRAERLGRDADDACHPRDRRARPRTVRLVRDDVKLEDQQAKMRIIDVPAPTRRAHAIGGASTCRLSTRTAAARIASPPGAQLETSRSFWRRPGRSRFRGSCWICGTTGADRSKRRSG